MFLKTKESTRNKPSKLPRFSLVFASLMSNFKEKLLADVKNVEK